MTAGRFDRLSDRRQNIFGMDRGNPSSSVTEPVEVTDDYSRIDFLVNTPFTVCTVKTRRDRGFVR